MMEDERTKKILSDICWKLEQGEQIDFSPHTPVRQWWSNFQRDQDREKMFTDHADRIRRTHIQQKIDLLRAEL